MTGASSGLGERFATDLAARGADLVVVARRRDRLLDLARRLGQRHSVSVLPVVADLCEPDAALSVHRRVADEGVVVSTLINSAGLGAAGPFASSEPSVVQAQVLVNTAALVGLTHAFLPALTARADGALVNVASMAAYVPVPGMAVYAASKAFVLHFTEALAVELRESPLKVLALSPGSTTTEFYAVSGTSEEGARFQTPEQVVATAFAALDARRTPRAVISGRYNRIARALGRSLPRGAAINAMARSVRAT